MRNADAYNGVCEVVNAFFIADEGGIDGVDDEWSPTDDEHNDDEN